MKELRVETWIKAGYKLAGSEGLHGIQVESLARALKLNKAGFYHYFGNMNHYIQCLLQHHLLLAKGIRKEINVCNSIDPDLLRLIVRNKEFFLVESQLLVKGKPIRSEEIFDEVDKVICAEFLPLWRRTAGLPEHSTVALPYLDILRHFFYARINSTNMKYEFLRQLTSETMDVLNEVAEEKYVLRQNIKASSN